MKTEPICRDADGNELIALEPLTEVELSGHPLLTHCLAVVKVGNDYLLGWNKWRRRYEIFGGCVEKGESPRGCIIRECREELGLEGGELRYLGAMKLFLVPDYVSKTERIEYGGLYAVTLPDMGVLHGIGDKEEIARLAFYSEIKGKEPVAPIDEALLAFH